MRKHPITVRVRRSISAALVLALPAAACNSSPDPDKELDTVRAWAATVELATSEHHAGATPRHFTTHLLDEAAKALEESRQTLSEVARSDEERGRARAATDSLATALQRARQEEGSR
jgi:Tfp pilus assembly protein PilF